MVAVLSVLLITIDSYSGSDRIRDDSSGRSSNDSSNKSSGSNIGSH